MAVPIVPDVILNDVTQLTIINQKASTAIMQLSIHSIYVYTKIFDNSRY